MRAFAFIVALFVASAVSANQSQMPGAPLSTSVPGGMSVAAADARYLKIDFSNVAQVAMTGPGIYEGTIGGFPAVVFKGDNTDQYLVLKSDFVDVRASDGSVIAAFADNGAFNSLELNVSPIQLDLDTNVLCNLGGVNGFSVDDATLSIDCTNNRVGILTTAPAYPLDLTASVNAGLSMHVLNNSTGGSAQATFYSENSAGDRLVAGMTGTGYSADGYRNANEAFVFSERNTVFFNPAAANRGFIFRVNDGTGTYRDVLHILNESGGGPGGVVINEDGSTIPSPFRVEGDTNANLIFVNGASDCLSLGSGTCVATTLRVDMAGGIDVRTSGTSRFTVDGSNAGFAVNALPSTDKVRDLGASTFRWDEIWVNSVEDLGDGSAASPAVNFDAADDAGLFYTTASDRLSLSNNTGHTHIRAIGAGSDINVEAADQLDLVADNDGGDISLTNLGATAGSDITLTTSAAGFATITSHARFPLTSSTAAYQSVRMPGVVNNTPAAKPTCSATPANAGESGPGDVIYYDDSNDANAGTLCLCSGDSALVYSWVRVDNTAAACP